MGQNGTTAQVNQLLAQVKALSSDLNEADRAIVQQSLLNALAHVETPYEHLFRLSGSHLQLACVRLGADVGLFRALAEENGPSSASQLSERVGVAPELLVRVLQFLASVGMVKESGKGIFSAEKITEALAKPSLGSGVHLLFDIHDRTFQALPDFLAEHQYQEVNDIHNTVFQKAFGTKLSIYEYLVHNPSLQAFMQDAMKQHQPEGDWLSVFPVDKELGNWGAHADPTRVLFVDIGGGMGQQSIRLREKYPDLVGRVILQDIPQTINRVPKPMPHGIEAMPHSFENPQPVKNAKFYYMRNVLHGLPDQGCIQVLKNLTSAMSKESRLIIDDVVLPDQGVSRQAAQLDFIMLASIAGKKRTKDQWHTILGSAGYRVLDIRTYTWPLQDSLIFAAPVLP